MRAVRATEAFQAMPPPPMSIPLGTEAEPRNTPPSRKPWRESPSKKANHLPDSLRNLFAPRTLICLNWIVFHKLSPLHFNQFPPLYNLRRIARDNHPRRDILHDNRPSRDNRAIANLTPWHYN